MCVCACVLEREQSGGAGGGGGAEIHFHSRELLEPVSLLVSTLSCNCHHQVILIKHPGELGSADHFVLA